MAEILVNNLGKTDGKRYMISDAAKMIDVESHVLRYWEEELDIEIPRNEMGHRYYTDYYIRVFKKIKELKDQGFLLKAIKIALPEIMNGNNVEHIIREQSLKEEPVGGEPTGTQLVTESDSGNELSVHHETDKLSKIEQFQMILGNVVTAVIQENNKELTKEMSKNVSDSVIKEVDYLLRIKEEKEEERYKKFDEMVRGLQKDNKQAAVKNAEKKRRLFGKK